MISKLISGRRLDRKPPRWLKWTKKNGPVAIHEQGELKYVLLSFDDYSKALSKQSEELPDEVRTAPPK